MIESATERCLQSLRSVHEDLLKISEETFFSSPLLHAFRSSVKAEWLGKGEFLEFFKCSFEELSLDEKYDAVQKFNSASVADQNQSSEFVVKEKLMEKVNLMEKELIKIKEEQALIELAIEVNLKRLEKNRFPVISHEG